MPTAEPEIRELIRARLLAGELPRNVQYQIFAGKGDGAHRVCRNWPVDSTQVLYEIRSTNRHGDEAALPMHLPCFNAWLIECVSPETNGRVFAPALEKISRRQGRAATGHLVDWAVNECTPPMRTEAVLTGSEPKLCNSSHTIYQGHRYDSCSYCG